MIQNSTVGPPAQGIPGLPAKEAAQKPREDSSGSFAKTLAGKDKPREPIAAPKRREEEHRAKSGKNESDEPPRNDAELKNGKEQQAPPGRKKNLTARESAIANFMDSFESEFEIPPTEMVEAMAHLKPQELSQSPEATAEKVVSKLGLDEADQEKAQAMYASLLMNLRQIDQAKPSAATGASGQLAVGGEQRAKMNDALEQLTQKFWQTKMAKGSDGQVAGPASRLEGVKDLAGLARNQDLSKLAIDEESFDPSLENEDAGLGDELAAHAVSELANADSAKGMDAGVAPDSSDELDADSAGEVPEKLANERTGNQVTHKSADASARHALSEDTVHEFESREEKPLANNLRAKAKSENDGQDEAAVAGSLGARAGQEARGQGKAAQDFLGRSGGGNAGAGKAGEKAAKEASTGAGSFKAAMSASTTPQPLKLEDVAAALKNNSLPGAASVPANVNPKDHEANVQQIISQAQILIKKGGGEMKVQMSPEGMGQIDLKLAMKDGKVQLQMATETPEAKKLIESSLADLRSSLAAHKLSVEHVKVDVVAGARTDNQARNETNMNQGQERQGTRQFWNQFQENFGNRQAREGLWDMPDMKGYRQAVRPAPLQPLDVKQASARPSTSGTGRGLNLVA